jgi:hypothetical protein
VRVESGEPDAEAVADALRGAEKDPTPVRETCAVALEKWDCEEDALCDRLLRLECEGSGDGEAVGDLEAGEEADALAHCESEAAADALWEADPDTNGLKEALPLAVSEAEAV